MAVEELFSVGMRFSSFEQIKKRISEYEKLVQQKFSKKHSKTIQACKLKGPYNEKLMYYEVHYACKCAGNFKSKGRGVRICRSYKTNCEAELKFRAIGRQYLTVIRFNDKHNHPPMLELIPNVDDECPVSQDLTEEVSIKEEPKIEHFSESSSREDFLNIGTAQNNGNPDLEVFQDASSSDKNSPNVESPHQSYDEKSDVETGNMVQKQLDLMKRQLQQIQVRQVKHEQRLKVQGKLITFHRKRIKRQDRIIKQQQAELKLLVAEAPHQSYDERPDVETSNMVQKQLHIMKQQLQQIQVQQEKHEQRLKVQGKLIVFHRKRIKRQDTIIKQQQAELKLLRRYLPIETNDSMELEESVAEAGNCSDTNERPNDKECDINKEVINDMENIETESEKDKTNYLCTDIMETPV